MMREPEPCAYCGENKWENRQKHLDELSEFLKQAAIALGSVKTEKKAASSRLNGKKGGRPKNPPKEVE